MKLFPVHSILWCSMVVLCASESETVANNGDVCQNEEPSGSINIRSSSVEEPFVEGDELMDNFRCLFYPKNILNCSWSFPTLQKDTRLLVNISICDDYGAVQAPNLSSEERVGSRSLVLHVDKKLHSKLRFNITLHGSWTVYTITYNIDMLEVLSPPPNISVSIKDGGLLVTWGLPHSRADNNPQCFEYQLAIGDQESPKNLTHQLSYTELNVDPTYTYSVKMRTRKNYLCQEFSQWSDWSHIVTVEQSIYKLSSLVIISISLGIPMILLTVLLLVRHQRVCNVLFPPIPHPPPKYKYFLEKNDTFNVFHPAASAEAEITQVEDTEQKRTPT